jgi:hypothetical protein
MRRVQCAVFSGRVGHAPGPRVRSPLRWRHAGACWRVPPNMHEPCTPPAWRPEALNHFGLRDSLLYCVTCLAASLMGCSRRVCALGEEAFNMISAQGSSCREASSRAAAYLGGGRAAV